MARIRTVKPEFWTDEKIVQLPYETRLLFIGLWNFSDDAGCIVDEPDRIAMQIFPGDDIDASGHLDLLVACGLLDRFTGDEKDVYRIVNFLVHQKISHPGESKLIAACRQKVRVPSGVRRDVAEKYGCRSARQPHPANCYYCDAPGAIYWPLNRRGERGSWVAFSRLELDHFVPESKNGETASSNIVLACRRCNRSKHGKDGISFLVRMTSLELPMIPEDSRAFAPEGNGKEGNGKEGNGKEGNGKEGNGKENTAPSTDGCPPELRKWLDWWNGLRAESLVSCGVDSERPAKVIVAAWNKSKGEAELKKPLADRDALAREIRRGQELLSDAGWFTLAKLLHGKNRTGEWIAAKLHEGAYADRKKRPLLCARDGYDPNRKGGDF